jgi:uncharacterized membrane protein YdbT with pleckstrin-like domain
MGFPRRLLSEGEDLVLDLRPHWIALVLPVAETVLVVIATIVALIYIPDDWPAWTRLGVGLAAIVLFLAWPLPPIVRWATSHFVVTTDRLINRTGWFAKHSMEIPLENISDVRFNQSVIERIIGAGDLTIESPGEFGQERFTDIRKPEFVQKTIYETTEANQRRMVAPSGPPTSVADELEKLAELRREGTISEEEFQAQKARLLGAG